MLDWTKINGWLSKEEGDALQELAFDGNVLEIGSMYGRSTVCMALVAKQVIAVDPHTATTISRRSQWYKKPTFERFMQNLRNAGVIDRVIPYRCTIQEMTLPRQFSLVFVDGDHSYGACMRDLYIAENLLVPGGIIAAHDYGNENTPGVVKAVDEYVKNHGCQKKVVGCLAILSDKEHK